MFGGAHRLLEQRVGAQRDVPRHMFYLIHIENLFRIYRKFQTYVLGTGVDAHAFISIYFHWIYVFADAGLGILVGL